MSLNASLCLAFGAAQAGLVQNDDVDDEEGDGADDDFILQEW